MSRTLSVVSSGNVVSGNGSSSGGGGRIGGGINGRRRRPGFGVPETTGRAGRPEARVQHRQGRARESGTHAKNTILSRFSLLMGWFCAYTAEACLLCAYCAHRSSGRFAPFSFPRVLFRSALEKNMCVFDSIQLYFR